MKATTDHRPQHAPLIDPAQLATLVQRIDSREYALSFSKLKAFRESPHAFVQYCLRTWQDSPAMKYGSMLHHYLLEPDTFDLHYCAATEKYDLRTNKGKEGFQAFQATLTVEDPTKPGATITRQAVTLQDMNKARWQGDAINRDPAARELLAAQGECEKWVSGEINGWKFNGKIDKMFGVDSEVHMLDIKTVTNAHPAQIRRTIRFEHYDMQQWIYRALQGGVGDHWIIAVDGDFEVCTMRIDGAALASAQRKFERVMTNFERCIFEESWLSSYSFWAKEGFYVLTDDLQY